MITPHLEGLTPILPGEKIQAEHWFYHYRLKRWYQVKELAVFQHWIIGCAWHNGWHSGFARLYKGEPKNNPPQASPY